MRRYGGASFASARTGIGRLMRGFWKAAPGIAGAGAFVVQATHADTEYWQSTGSLWKNSTTQKLQSIGNSLIQRITFGYAPPIFQGNGVYAVNPDHSPNFYAALTNKFFWGGIAAEIIGQMPFVPYRSKVRRFAKPLAIGGFLGGLIDDTGASGTAFSSGSRLSRSPSGNAPALRSTVSTQVNAH
jgi:hypothetical protein